MRESRERLLPEYIPCAPDDQYDNTGVTDTHTQEINKREFSSSPVVLIFYPQKVTSQTLMTNF
jgi:peroxiredoxin